MRVSSAKAGLLKCASCGCVTSYTALLERLSSVTTERAARVIEQARSVRAALRAARQARTPVEALVDNMSRDSGLSIALMKGDRLEYRVVNASYAAIREAGVSFLDRSYKDVFPEAAELGAEARLREVLETGKAWQIEGFETPIPGRAGPTWWEGDVLPVASNGNGIDSVLVVNWEITERKLAERALLQGEAPVD